jgi:hypothetical protein
VRARLNRPPEFKSGPIVQWASRPLRQSPIHSNSYNKVGRILGAGVVHRLQCSRGLRFDCQLWAGRSRFMTAIVQPTAKMGMGS